MALLDVPQLHRRRDAGAAGAVPLLGRGDAQLARVVAARPCGSTATRPPPCCSACSRGRAGSRDWPAYRHQPIEFQDEPVVVARIDQLGVPGFSVYVPPARAAALTAALVAAGARVASQDAIEVATDRGTLSAVRRRHDRGHHPARSRDRGAGDLHRRKGCYVGQEVIIRVLHRGHGRVARKLVGLTIDGPKPEPGAKLTAAGREVGWITSAAVSTARGHRGPRLRPPRLPGAGYGVDGGVADGSVRRAITILKWGRASILWRVVLEK